jgi:hypothetical protein
MDLKVEQWPIDRLIPYARNPRKNDAQVDRMCAAILEFGFRIPIVARSDGSIVDGHLRLKAARKLGLKDVPVALADELSDVQVKAFRLLANQSANWAEWDNELLALELEELKASDSGIISMMESDSYVTGPVNIGNPEEITILELAKTIIEKVRSSSKIVFRPIPDDDPTRRVPDIGKASAFLGFKPTTSLDEGLELTIPYYINLRRGVQ